MSDGNDYVPIPGNRDPNAIELVQITMSKRRLQVWVNPDFPTDHILRVLGKTMSDLTARSLRWPAVTMSDHNKQPQGGQVVAGEKL